MYVSVHNVLSLARFAKPTDRADQSSLRDHIITLDRCRTLASVFGVFSISRGSTVLGYVRFSREYVRLTPLRIRVSGIV